jgi:hypothetical protein
MWKEFKEDNLENSYSMLTALKSLDALGIRPSDIKIVSYPSVKIFYYENELKENERSV